MLFYSFYLLFKNNIESICCIKYTSCLLKSLLFITCTYTIPLTILTSLTTLSNNNLANNVSKYLYFGAYYLPTYIIILIIHNSRLIKLLEKRYIVYNNPSHIYITLFYGFIYALLGICSSIFNINSQWSYIIFTLDAVSYGLFFNEIAYIFTNPAVSKYTNKIDFYNNNFVVFNVYGVMLNLILHKVPYLYFMPVSYIVTGIMQNALISNEYVVYNRSNKTYNILYPFEKIFNMFVTFISTFIFFSLHGRKMTYSSVII